MIDIISFVFLITGSFFLFTSAIGCLRFSDFFVRIHAAGVGECCGCPLILIGLMIQTGFTILTFKLFLLMIFVMITSSTACHSLALSALTTSFKKIEKKRNA